MEVSSYNQNAGDSATTLISVAVGVILLVLSAWRIRSSASSKGRRLPPGPFPWPVVGNMFTLADTSRPVHLILGDLAKKYGPLMSMKLGAHTTVIATDSAMAKEILKTQNHNFASRSRAAVGEILNYSCTNIVWSAYGDYLRLLRKLVATELLSAARVASFEKMRLEECLLSVQSILEQCNGGTGTIVMGDETAELAANNISRMLFGKTFFRAKSLDGEIFDDKEEFMNATKEVSRFSMTFVIGDFIPFLKPFDIGGHVKAMKKLAHSRDAQYSRILDEHRRGSSKDKDDEDFVDTLLRLSSSNGLTDANVKAILVDLIFAGTDTSANQICWTMAEIIRHPHVIKRLVAELDSVVGRNRVVAESDIQSLEYLQAVVKESFRLHPVAKLLPYESINDTYIGGYFIPAKTRIFVNNHFISRDGAKWENPTEFDPSRFLEGKDRRDVKGQDFDMLPFGSGRRICSGMTLGLLSVQLVVAQLVHLIHWELPQGVRPEDVDITDGFGIAVPMKTDLRLIGTPRLDPAVLKTTLESLSSRK